ncbi:hypothetical protein [Kitasatospora griseola]|uniref:hypothetical protein n=1 Tax=Kitasatospora griseola TaxID=2064 RepID=UPI001670E5E0|nr:hypothetical protein [Kitasatospora griseola]
MVVPGAAVTEVLQPLAGVLAGRGVSERLVMGEAVVEARLVCFCGRLGVGFRASVVVAGLASGLIQAAER